MIILYRTLKLLPKGEFLQYKFLVPASESYQTLYLKKQKILKNLFQLDEVHPSVSEEEVRQALKDVGNVQKVEFLQEFKDKVSILVQFENESVAKKAATDFLQELEKASEMSNSDSKDNSLVIVPLLSQFRGLKQMLQKALTIELSKIKENEEEVNNKNEDEQNSSINSIKIQQQQGEQGNNNAMNSSKKSNTQLPTSSQHLQQKDEDDNDDSYYQQQVFSRSLFEADSPQFPKKYTNMLFKDCMIEKEDEDEILNSNEQYNYLRIGNYGEMPPSFQIQSDPLISYQQSTPQQYYESYNQRQQGSLLRPMGGIVSAEELENTSSQSDDKKPQCPLQQQQKQGNGNTHGNSKFQQIHLQGQNLINNSDADQQLHDKQINGNNNNNNIDLLMLQHQQQQQLQGNPQEQHQLQQNWQQLQHSMKNNLQYQENPPSNLQVNFLHPQPIIQQRTLLNPIPATNSPIHQQERAAPNFLQSPAQQQSALLKEQNQFILQQQLYLRLQTLYELYKPFGEIYDIQIKGCFNEKEIQPLIIFEKEEEALNCRNALINETHVIMDKSQMEQENLFSQLRISEQTKQIQQQKIIDQQREYQMREKRNVEKQNLLRESPQTNLNQIQIQKMMVQIKKQQSVINNKQLSLNAMTKIQIFFVLDQYYRHVLANYNAVQNSYHLVQQRCIDDQTEQQQEKYTQRSSEKPKNQSHYKATSADDINSQQISTDLQSNINTTTTTSLKPENNNQKQSLQQGQNEIQSDMSPQYLKYPPGWSPVRPSHQIPLLQQFQESQLLYIQQEQMKVNLQQQQQIQQQKLLLQQQQLQQQQQIQQMEVVVGKNNNGIIDLNPNNLISNTLQQQVKLLNNNQNKYNGNIADVPQYIQETGFIKSKNDGNINNNIMNKNSIGNQNSRSYDIQPNGKSAKGNNNIGNPGTGYNYRNQSQYDSNRNGNSYGNSHLQQNNYNGNNNSIKTQNNNNNNNSNNQKYKYKVKYEVKKE